LSDAGFTVSRAGSLLTVFFRGAAPVNYREAKESDTDRYAAFFNTLRSNGVLIPPSQFEAWFVSSAHDESTVDATIDALTAVSSESC
jgi:glutamate-1-semialdehyde 2,1-aminomutase